MSVLNQGDRVGNYLLEERVGAGSFGQVWRAKHHVFDDIAAIKIPTDPDYVRNLQREGVAIHGLRHPNIVRAIDLDPYGDPPYLVMEYVDGPSLRELIDARGPVFPIHAAVAVMRGLLRALSAAHNSGLIHRDIKPANILIATPPPDLATLSDRSVKVTDFGLGQVGGMTTGSIMQSGSMETAEGRSIAGTLAYMSPEQKEGVLLTPRSDLFACGVVLYEMLTGQRPQGGDAPGLHRSDTPGWLDTIFRRCYTAWDRRYESADEVLAAMDRAGADIPPMRPLAVSLATPPIVPPALPLARATAKGESPKCPKCSGVLENDDQFCIHCGVQVVSRVATCGSCQAYIRPGDRFCISCGHDLGVLA